ncbi:MAG: hypothetical protein F6J97_12665 [Leptolyngbya sp. SIO4C1]|nr:hypothetical protein [Leptolyngbya sp. SIO4C1]
MASNLDKIAPKRERPLLQSAPAPRSASLPTPEAAESQPINSAMRDRFELLSAYLDGEVSPDEHRLVANWLAHDAGTQHLYNRLLLLRQAMRSLPVEPAASSLSANAVAFRVACHRLRIMALAAVCTASAVVLSSSGLTNPALNFWSPTWLSTDAQPTEALQIILEEPAIEMYEPDLAVDRTVQ